MPIPGGCVLRTPDLAIVRHLNVVVLDAPLGPGLDADGLVALADRWLEGWPTASSASTTRPARERLEGELVERAGSAAGP